MYVRMYVYIYIYTYVCCGVFKFACLMILLTDICTCTYTLFILADLSEYLFFVLYSYYS